MRSGTRRRARQQREGRRPELAAGKRIEGDRRPTAAAGVAATLIGLLVLGGVVWHFFGRRSPGPAPAPNLTEDGSTRSGGGSAASRAEGGTNSQVASLVSQGNELLRQGKAEEAVKVYAEAQHLQPGDEDVHYNLGIALARLGRDAEAVAAYRRALEIFPQYAEAHNNLGNVLHRQGKIDEAVEHFRAAIAAIPDYASAHNNLGNALRQQGLMAEATQEFLKASRLDTNYWQARFNLGTAYLTQARFEEAAAEYRAVLALQPDFVPARKALEAALEKRTPPAQGPGPPR